MQYVFGGVSPPKHLIGAMTAVRPGRAEKSKAIRKAVWFCLPFTGGVAACRYLLPAGIYLPAALLCALAACAGLLFRDGRRLCVLLAALGACIGCLDCWAQQHFVIDPAEALAGESGTVSVRVTEYPDVYDDSAYVTARLTEPGMPGVKCRLISYTAGELDSLVPGDRLRCQVRFLSASRRNGEETDTYFSKGIFLRAICTGAPETVGRWPGAFLYAPLRLKKLVVEQCARLFPSDASPFMTALLTGDKTALYSGGGDYYVLGEAGLAHVVAVSGMHISYLMGCLFFLLGRRRSAVALSFPLLLFFAAMTGFTPSVTRAVFMQLYILTAPLLRREGDSPTSLAVALAVILLGNPSAVTGASLQLSFASMAGIWLLSERLYRRAWARISGWKIAGYKPAAGVLRFIAGTVSTGLGAQLFTLPLSAAHFGYVSVVAVLSGAACLWMVSTLYIGGYAVVLVGTLLPGLAGAAGGVLAWGVRYIYWVARLLTAIPCAAVYTSNPLFALWVVFAYALFLTAWLCGRRSGGTRLIVPACLSLITLYGCALATRLCWGDELRLTALDVGQGESVVLACGPRTVLVDCGGSYLTRDAGETAVGFLAGQQRLHLDALILTHLHSDHVNGAARVLSRLDVDTLYLPLQADDDGCLPEILAAARQRGTRVEYVTENLILRVGEMDLTVWAPQLPDTGDENENCLFVMAQQGDFEAMITGDNTAEAERLLVSRYTLPDAEVLVAGHHGSATSTGAALLEALRPDLAVISVGYNTYGHPSRRVLERLEEYSIPVLRTDQEGNITVSAGKER